MKPKKWTTKSLGEISKFKSGGTPSKSNPNFWGGDIPWVTAKDMKTPLINNSIDKLTPEAIKVAKLAPCETLLILVRGMTLHKDLPLAITTRELAFNQDIKALTTCKEVLPMFLMVYLSSQKHKILQLVDSAGHGTGRLDTELLKSFPINYPTIFEQKQIVGTLATWDNAIKKTAALITAKEKQFEWLCQTYFRPGNSTNSGWKKHKIEMFVTVRNEREVPSEEVPLYSLTIENGVTAKTDRYNREFLVIDKDAKKYKVVHPKDIVFNPANLRWGAIARSEVEHKVVLSPIYEVLNVDENKIDSDFLTHALTCPRQIAIFATMVEGTLVERMAVKIDTFLSCHIYAPSSKKEQKEIAHVLNLSKQEISLLKKTLEQYRSQKRGLMQKLLTGEWRVGSFQFLSEETDQEITKESVT